ncbi:MAG: hypothetical protein K8R46_10845 [Pirellulales bacterium]|nr:hypothetical protein [Pirellulales bacterium]
MRYLCRLVGAAVVWGTALVAAGQGAEEEHCKLELVRLESGDAGGSIASDKWILRNISSQTFVLRVHKGVQSGVDEEGFKKAVKKEPAKYSSKYPLRGMATLGSKQYGFVLDKKDEKSNDYDRLYFDLNGNGDLTDDKPIDKPTVKQIETPPGVWSWLFSPKPSRVKSEFPRVDLAIDVDGKKLDYSFFFEARGWGRGANRYVWVSLKSAVYRQCTLTLDEKKRKIVVLDHNSNGRFNDVVSLSKNIRGSKNELTPYHGDMLLFKRQKAAGTGGERWNEFANKHRQYLAKLTVLDDKFYHMKVSPPGDELTWSLSSIPRGQITSPHAPCSVQLIGELGQINLNLDGSKPATVPAGQWRVLSYSIQVKDWKKPEKKEEPKAEKEGKDVEVKPSLLGAIAESLFGSSTRSSRDRSNMSVVYARGTTKGEVVTVRPEQTAALKFGPPYKLRATVNTTPGIAHLSLVIQGTDSEVVSYMMVNGNRPGKPKITITDPKGKVVVEGNFEYG